MSQPIVSQITGLVQSFDARVQATAPEAWTNQSPCAEWKARDVVVHEIDSVLIPFASPRLLWRMKAVTHREKDAGDLVFLRHWFAGRNQEPPAG